METFEKAINEHGELVLVRTPNMQQILNFCYAKMPIIAIMQGKSLEMAYLQTISDYLKSAYKNPMNTKWVSMLLEETGVDGLTGHAFDTAANLIFKSKIVKK